MKLQEKIKNYWHMPTKVFAFYKFLLKNRNIEVKNDLYCWIEEVEKIKDLTLEEEELLKKIILGIDKYQEEFTLNNLFLLTKDTYKSHYKDRYVLLKYSPFVTYYDAWNIFYEQSRGVVIDLEKLHVATASLKKFYNLEEKEETSTAVVFEKIQNAKNEVVKYDKVDGSNVNVSYKDELLVTTPGDFASNQAKKSKRKLLEEKSSFLDDLRTKMNHLTFIFEYVAPDNRIVVKYEKEELVLLHVVNSENGMVLPYEEVLNYAKKYGFTMCSIEEKSMDEILKDRNNKEKYKSNEKEGWVIRIDDEKETFFVKLKCSDYVDMHKMVSDYVSPRYVLSSILDETFDDKISLIENEKIKKIAQRIADKIYDFSVEKKSDLMKAYNSIDKNIWIDDEKIEKQRKINEFIKKETEDYENKEKISKFLIGFSKGKTENPKEETVLKASKLLTNKQMDLEKLSELDSYKSLVNNKTKKLLSEIKKAVKTFVYEGKTEKEFEKLLNEFFSEYKNLPSEVEDLEAWLEKLKKDKKLKDKLTNAKRENLSTKNLKISNFLKKEKEVEQKLIELNGLIKKELYEYFFFGKHKNKYQMYFDQSLIANQNILDILSEKEEFEKYAKSFFEKENGAVFNSILKEYYIQLRGLMPENSYPIAKSIWEKLDDDLKDQKDFYKEKGIFDMYLYKNVEDHFKTYLEEMFLMKENEKLDYLNKLDLTSKIKIILSNSNKKDGYFSLDFSFFEEEIKETAIEEN